MKTRKIKPLKITIAAGGVHPGTASADGMAILAGVPYAALMAPLLLALGIYAMHLMLKLRTVTCLVLAAGMLALMIPQGRRYQEMHRQKQRFSDACLYMETLLYAFAREGKVLRAFEDTLNAFPMTPMKQVLQEAYAHMQYSYEETAVLEHALEMVETAYPCHRILTIHSFLLHVEYYGGDVEDPITLLIEDKNRWERRIRQEMRLRENEFRQIILSVLASVAICSAILMLPVRDVDISSNPVLQIMSVAVIWLDDLILFAGQRYLMADYLRLDMGEEDARYVERMKDYRAYSPQKEQTRSLLYMIPALAMAAICLVFGQKTLFLAGCLAALLLANQHRIGHRIAGNALKKHIRSTFPGWLMDLALLLQTENVQMALTKSRETVPGLLRMELDNLLARLELSPEAAAPYHEFLKDFALPEVHSAMSLLYSLSAGSSQNAQKQMEDLIAKNLEMLDQAEAIRMKDKRSGMFLLFLAPVLTASVKLLTDMGIFLLTFLSVTMQTMGR